MSHAQAASLLNVEVVTFRHQIGLLKDPPEATVEEQEFDQLLPWVAQGVDAEWASVGRALSSYCIADTSLLSNFVIRATPTFSTGSSGNKS